MEYQKKLKLRFVCAIGYLILGIVMAVTSWFSQVSGNYMFSMGIAMVTVGVLKIIRYAKIIKNPEAIRKQELSEKDERYQMLSERARSWAFSLYITRAGVAVIVLNLLGHAQTALPYAWSICGLLILYSGSWHFLQKKY